MRLAATIGLVVLTGVASAQRPSTFRCKYVLAPDGATWLEDAVVTVIGSTILKVEVGAPEVTVDADYGEAWMIPGLIDLHTHVCLYPYDQKSWTDQVLTESLELRSIRAAKHARQTLDAGFVAIRDLGTEGAGLVDVALRDAIAARIVPGPRIFATTRAIAATGCYGPALPRGDVPKGAQLAHGPVGVRVAVREQIAAGADWIKVYADYRRTAGAASTPTFTLEELEAIVDEARSAGVSVAAHATTAEGMRRAAVAGVRTIEHGGPASEETFALMREQAIVLCPCLAATEAIVRYRGHRGPNVARLNTAKIAFQRARAAGVTIACGSDAGVFAHGDNARELELLVDYGMTPVEALAAATTVAADVLGDGRLGRIEQGAAPGLVVLGGDPLADVGNLRHVRAVILGESGDVRSTRR